LGQLYYLPLRITQTLGWIGLSTILAALLPDVRNLDDSSRFDLATEILNRHESSIVAVSDEQASALYVFLKACLLKNKRGLAERVTNAYFASFADRGGNVTRVGTDGSQALRYILSLGSEEYRPNDWRPANPSHLLPVLLLFGAKLGLGSTWDLRALDRKSTAFSIPADYREFGRQVVEHGMNHTHQIGFGVWTVSEYDKEFERALEEGLSPTTLALPNEGAALCTISSLLFPDRLPLLLERILPEPPLDAAQ
jgi:hypothetical protein